MLRGRRGFVLLLWQSRCIFMLITNSSFEYIQWNSKRRGDRHLQLAYQVLFTISWKMSAAGPFSLQRFEVLLMFIGCVYMLTASKYSCSIPTSISTPLFTVICWGHLSFEWFFISYANHRDKSLILALAWVIWACNSLLCHGVKTTFGLDIWPG